MRETIIQFLESTFGSAHALIVLIGSAIPITEMRATIPLGILTFGMNPWEVMILALIGTLLPVPFLLLFFEQLLKWLHKIPFTRGLARFLDEKVQKNAARFEKSTEAALILFVAIPLPGTGVWTGSMVASVLGFRFLRSFVCVVLGALLSAIVLTLGFSFFNSMFA